MFFNEDILFRNGSLALVWMAGNEEFKNKKGRRHRTYMALLKANVKDIWLVKLLFNEIHFWKVCVLEVIYSKLCASVVFQ